jgi:hypothetical protein
MVVICDPPTKGSVDAPPFSLSLRQLDFGAGSGLLLFNRLSIFSAFALPFAWSLASILASNSDVSAAAEMASAAD